MTRVRGGVVLLLTVAGPYAAHGQELRAGSELWTGWQELPSVGMVPETYAVNSPTSASALPGRGYAGRPGSSRFTLPAVPERRPVPRANTGRAARATAMSALLPGSGQLYVGQSRGWVYLTLEVIAWGLWIDRRSAGANARDRYRDFAWEEARIHDGPRIDGDFDFYETLSKWERSGAFDVDPGSAGVQPESDVATFNGTIWRRAEGLYLPGGSGTPETDPGYIRAMGYYEDFAYADGFLWDWGGTGDARDTYAGLIRSSDARYREATNVLGAIIANHVVSAVDAFLSSRGMAVPVEARVLPASGIGGSRWTARVSVTP